MAAPSYLMPALWLAQLLQTELLEGLFAPLHRPSCGQKHNKFRQKKKAQLLTW